jgi:anti-anti-sigma factor
MKPGASSIADIKVDTFSTRSERRGDAITISLSGNADMAVHERLKGFLEGFDHLAKRERLKEVLFDLQELYFMNSSCLSLLLRMINGVLEPRNSHKYKIRFRSNPNLRWQKKSLQALQTYAPDIVAIE